jgi:hypothetical protein
MRLWDLQTGKEIRRFNGPGNFVEAVGDLAPKRRVYTQIRSLIRHTGLLARELPPSTFEGVDCKADSQQSLRDAIVVRNAPPRWS